MADAPVTKKDLAALQKQMDGMQKQHDELRKWFLDEKKAVWEQMKNIIVLVDKLSQSLQDLKNELKK